MFIKRVVAAGLAHYSYLIGDQGEAVVIDPRRDIDLYLKVCETEGCHLGMVLETHRHEDFVVGSREIAAAAGASIFHADSALPYTYGQGIKDGDTWHIGRLKIKALHTPGHTPGSMSFLLYDPEGHPWMIFTGDALFSGDVGRVDLVDVDRREEMAGLLYDSLFERILPLGDSLILCPAHGAGSACGTAIAERTWTTIGMERHYNPRLQYPLKTDFIQATARILPKPPYFRRMEVLNLQEAPFSGTLPFLKPLTPAAFEQAMSGAQILDTRSIESFGGGHIPGSTSIWQGRLSSFAGWFLVPDLPILLVSELGDVDFVRRTLFRMGFDQMAGILQGGIQAWSQTGKPLVSIPTPSVEVVCDQSVFAENTFLLDIRRQAEVDAQPLSGAAHIPLIKLSEHIDTLPHDRPIMIFCGSGVRSMIAASYLENRGFHQLIVPVGGTRALAALGCQLPTQSG